jgi:hypothetical protein
MTRFGAGTGALVSFGLDGGGVVARPSSTPLADGRPSSQWKRKAEGRALITQARMIITNG